MDWFQGMNIEQLKHIKNFIYYLDQNDKKFEELDSEILNQHLTLEEIVLFYQFLVKFYQEKLKIYSSKFESEFELSWKEYNPYQVLGVKKKDYTKDELLNILNSRMNNLELEKNKQKRKILTDKILDAYNDIINKRV